MTSGTPRWRTRLAGVALDVTPLREFPTFRRLWFGEAVSLVGTQMTAVAVPLQVYGITKSSFAVGMLGLVAFVPLVVGGLFGGAAADARDRRTLALVTSTCLMVVSALFWLQAVLGLRQVWLLYLLTGVQSALFAVDSPTRRSIVPRLIPAAQMPAATALSQVLFNFGVVVGPLLAGQIISAAGLGWAYAVDVVSFVAALVALRGLPPIPPTGAAVSPRLGSVAAGLRYLWTQPVVLMTFAVDINAMIFGMPRALFPELAATRFPADPEAAAARFYAAPAVGALAGALLGGWFSRVRRQGLAVLVAVAGWGLAILAFGLTRDFWLSCLFLALAGAADMVSAVFRTSILQVATPDEMRGRLSGVFIVVVAGGPRLGDVEAGAVAALTSPTFSVVSGGIACLAGVVLLAAAVPSFARYRPPPDG